MLFDVNGLPTEVRIYIEMYKEDTKSLSNLIEEVRERISEEYRPILDEVEKTILSGERAGMFKALYLLNRELYRILLGIKLLRI